MKYLNHRGYLGNVEVGENEEYLYGRVVGIRYGLFYEGETFSELKQDFINTVEQYIEDCESGKVKALKPFSGKLTLRLEPAQHGLLSEFAKESNKSLNTLILDYVANGLVQDIEKKSKLEESQGCESIEFIKNLIEAFGLSPSENNSELNAGYNSEVASV